MPFTVLHVITEWEGLFYGEIQYSSRNFQMHFSELKLYFDSKFIEMCS